MSVTKVSHIKPKNHLASRVNEKLQKSSLRAFEQAAIGYVVGVVSEAKFLGSVASLTDQQCESLELAPIERGRFTDAVTMAVKEAGRITFSKVDGHTATSQIYIDIDTKKLERAFSLYASGSFRRNELRNKYGNDLELLLTRNSDEVRKELYNVTIDAQFGELEGVPQIITYSTHRNSDNWITRAISSNIKHLVNKLNTSMQNMYTS